MRTGTARHSSCWRCCWRWRCPAAARRRARRAARPSLLLYSTVERLALRRPAEHRHHGRGQRAELAALPPRLVGGRRGYHRLDRPERRADAGRHRPAAPRSGGPIPTRRPRPWSSTLAAGVGPRLGPSSDSRSSAWPSATRRRPHLYVDEGADVHRLARRAARQRGCRHSRACSSSGRFRAGPDHRRLQYPPHRAGPQRRLRRRRLLPLRRLRAGHLDDGRPSTRPPRPPPVIPRPVNPLHLHGYQPSRMLGGHIGKAAARQATATVFPLRDVVARRSRLQGPKAAWLPALGAAPPPGPHALASSQTTCWVGPDRPGCAGVWPVAGVVCRPAMQPKRLLPWAAVLVPNRCPDPALTPGLRVMRVAHRRSRPAGVRCYQLQRRSLHIRRLHEQRVRHGPAIQPLRRGVPRVRAAARRRNRRVPRPDRQRQAPGPDRSPASSSRSAGCPSRDPTRRPGRLALGVERRGRDREDGATPFCALGTHHRGGGAAAAERQRRHLQHAATVSLRHDLSRGRF